MLTRTSWRTVEAPCPPAEAQCRWYRARSEGATGAVTSWGSGIRGRETLRTYWEVRPGVAIPEGEDLVEENWTPYWRDSLRVVQVTERVTLVPAWEEPPGGTACALRIDPGMAFGAGDHPTTRLCLHLLEELCSRSGPPGNALDVGAGTGVLALAAACLGVGRVDALDIDPFGYAACRRNVRLNGLEERVRPLLLSLDLLDGAYPLLLANIVAPQLEALAPLLRDRLAPGGRLVLSGFEVDGEARVRDSLELPVEERRAEGTWMALMVRSEERSSP